MNWPVKHAFLLPLLFVSSLAAAEGRFILTGDGKISLKNKNTGVTAVVTYRNGDSYDRAALDRINQLFGVAKAQSGEDVSLRLISMLDYVQDRYLPGKTLIIVSGYRSPTHNANLRKKGRTAGETSYHMDAMAADVDVGSVALAKKIWEEMRALEYGGMGNYGGGTIHIDSGRPRFWTKETALPKDKEPPGNRNIYATVDKDIYREGERMQIAFSGISEYPVRVRLPFSFKSKSKVIEEFDPEMRTERDAENCAIIRERKDGRLIFDTIASDLKNRELAVEIEFCGDDYPKMPKEILSRPFEVR